VVLPSHIDPGADAGTAREQVDRALQSGSSSLWSRSPDAEEGKSMLLTVPFEIGSAVQGRTRFRLSNTFRVTVRVRPEGAERVNVLSTCAGAEAILRSSDVVELVSRPTEYTTEVTFPQGDYFSLMPGEFEEFVFKFRCVQPGVYAIGFAVPFTLRSRPDTLRFVHPDLVCPRSLYRWQRTPSYTNRLSGGDELVSPSY
jgi:hypothetical protein